MRWMQPRSGLAAVLASLALTVSGLAQAQAQASPAPLICTGQLYQMTAGSTAGSDTQVWLMGSDYRHGTSPLFTVPGVSLNGLAFNPQDRFLYAVNDYTDNAGLRLYRLNATGVVADAKITNSAGEDVAGINSRRNSGTFDAHGNLFMADGWIPPYQRLYLVTGAATMQPQARRITIQTDTSPPGGYTGVALDGTTGGINVGDLAFSPAESSATTAVLYGTRNVQASDDTPRGVYLYRIVVDLTAPTPTARASRIATTLPRLITYGSAYLGADGGLIVSANNNAFYRVNVTNGSHTVLTAANGDANTNTDGTTCIAVPLVDVVKQAGAPVAVLNGHTFDVPYTLTVGNTGAVPTPNVQISDNLRNAFAAGTPTLGISAGPAVTAGSCTLSGDFDGTSRFSLLSGTDNLPPGASCTVQFTVRVAYASAGAVPSTAQRNTALASSASSANAGHSWPGGVPAPPANLLAQDESTNAAALPASPNSDAPAPTPLTLAAIGPITFEKTITSGANPLSGGTVAYGITVRNGGAAPVLYPAGSVTLALRVAVDAGVAPGTVITNTITPPAGTSCAPAPAGCSVPTTVRAPPADMGVVMSGLPSVVSPGSTVSGEIRCIAVAGTALAPTCSATAQDSDGAAIPVAVGTCTPTLPVAALAAGSSITCPISFTAPGVAGGTDTGPTGVTVTATTGASNDNNPANNSDTGAASIIDAVDDTAVNQPAGATAATHDVSGNDQVPAGSVFALGAGSTCANPALGPTGLATFDVPASGGCTVVYQVCAPAPNQAVCDTAVLTVSAGTGPQARDDSAALAASGPTTLSVLANDPGQAQAAPGSIMLANPPAGATLTPDGQQLTVPGQGVWTVNGDEVVFSPAPGFGGVPTPVGYSFANAAGDRSNVATITLTAPVGAVTAVPTLSHWALMALAAMLGALGLRQRLRGAR